MKYSFTLMASLSMLALIVGLMAGITMGSALGGGKLASMASGNYEVCHIQRAYDPYSGEPVYWITAEPLDVNGVHGDVRFYTIPRKAIANVPDDGGPEPNLRTFKLRVERTEKNIAATATGYESFRSAK